MQRLASLAQSFSYSHYITIDYNSTKYFQIERWNVWPLPYCGGSVNILGNRTLVNSVYKNWPRGQTSTLLSPRFTSKRRPDSEAEQQTAAAPGTLCLLTSLEKQRDWKSTHGWRKWSLKPVPNLLRTPIKSLMIRSTQAACVSAV